MRAHQSHYKDLGKATVTIGLGLLIVLLVVGIKPTWLTQGIRDYLPLHTMLETLSIIFAALIFGLLWGLRRERIARNNVLLASGFLGVALLDFCHVLSYDGMPDFITPASPEKAIFFWLAARFLTAVILILVACLSWQVRSRARQFKLWVLTVLTLVLALNVFYFKFGQGLPRTFIAEGGLTAFKVSAEYLLILMYLVAAVLLLRYMRASRSFPVGSLIAAACLMAQGEFFLTLYAGVSDLYNLAGHLYKVWALLLLLRAIFAEAIQFPYVQMRATSKAMMQSPIGMVITDASHHIELFNDAYARMVDCSAQELMGRTPFELQSSRTPAATTAALREQLARGTTWYGELIRETRSGQRRILSTVIFPIHDDDKISHHVAQIEDITERRRMAEELRQLSRFDQLTGLPNRLMLEDYFEEAYSSTTDRTALLWIDIDQFHTINDALGHPVGDLALRELSLRLRRGLQSRDMLSRLSGDGFAVVVHSAGLRDIARLADELLALAAQPLPLRGLDLSLTISIGIAIFPDDASDLHVLLRHAENAMRQAKRDGRNRYCFFRSDMQALSLRALALANALRKAIRENELHLVYQPQIRASDQRMIGAEALLRWHSSEWGTVSPHEFIPIAEASGLIVPLSDWVLQTAVSQIRDWRQRGLPDLCISVNLSAVQFDLPDLPGRIQQILQQADVPPACLSLELTEAVAMRAPDLAAQRIQELHDGGIRTAIDDFGTGYSSLSYLKRFRVGWLKIDQSFVRDLEDNPDDQAIIQAIIQLARSLGISTIAEGVETAGQQAFLQAQGCDSLQGYFLSQPLEPEAFERFVRDRC